MTMIDRRLLLTLGAAGALAAAGGSVLAQETVDVADLHAPGQLGDKVLGPSDAKVTVVEYASLSCPHCATFDKMVFDDFRLKYIDSGKVRYIFREFPLNAPAFVGAMVTRCAPADRYFETLHAYFRSQETWLAAPDIKGAMVKVAEPFGFTPESFDACAKNEALFTSINAVKARGESFGVQATPTFFINGKKFEGALTLDELDKAIAPLL